MRLLLHTCCAPCTIFPVEYLRTQGYEVYGYFFNPNIHPYTEWLKRKEALQNYAQVVQLEMLYDDGYQLEEFLQQVVYRKKNRCLFCYAFRLHQAAKIAKEENFNIFSTTLLVSPYQQHDLIKEIGKAAGAKNGLTFHYVDFRPGFRKAQKQAKELNLYRQQYCGCILSERDRYYPKVSRKKR